jgi:hypothetical protein
LVDTVEDGFYTTAVGLMMLDMLLVPQDTNIQMHNNHGGLQTITSFIQRLWR